jgi:hypothetical protein
MVSSEGAHLAALVDVDVALCASPVPVVLLADRKNVNLSISEVKVLYYSTRKTLVYVAGIRRQGAPILIQC